jgi:hypothetical protein
MGLFAFFLTFYAGLIASTGHASVQAAQSVHSSGLIEYTVPSDIASAGHSPAQAPHAVHNSLSIVKAIIFCFNFLKLQK